MAELIDEGRNILNLINNNAESKALSYMNENPLFHIGMIFPIKRGTSNIIYADTDGVFLRETESGAYMLSVKSLEKGRNLLDSIGWKELFTLYQKPMADYLNEKHKYPKQLVCFQTAYERKSPVKSDVELLEIKKLDVSYIDYVFAQYHDNVDYDYLKRRIELGAIFGGFYEGELCGFVGTHAEGSIGILEVLDKYRQRGFGAGLMGFMTNHVLNNNQIPFSQVSPDNLGSIKLHEKLGYKISSEKLYWLF